MPQWRKLYVKTTESLDINDMPDDFTRLLWVLLPLGLDREGRGLDNLSWIKSKIFPLRIDVTLDTIEKAFDWFEKRNMILRYEVEGRKYFMIPHGIYTREVQTKEATSSLPAPVQLQTYSGPTLDLLRSRSTTDVDSDSDSEKDYAPDGANHRDKVSIGYSEGTHLTETEYKERIVEAIARGINKDGDIKQSLIDLFHITPNWNTKGNRLFLQWAKGLPPDQPIEQFARWWYSPANWRSKGHSPPSLAQIMELWLQAFVEKKDDEVFAQNGRQPIPKYCVILRHTGLESIPNSTQAEESALG